jgi:hypothetical protein
MLAIDAEGRLAIIELKRDRTPRDVVARVLEYGAWAATLGLQQVEEIYALGYGDSSALSHAPPRRSALRFLTCSPEKPIS